MTDAAADGTPENGAETKNSRVGRCAPPGRSGVVANETRIKNRELKLHHQPSEVDADSHLHRPRRIALRDDLAERGRAPVRVRVAVKRQVEEIAELRLEPEPLSRPRIGKTLKMLMSSV